MRPVIVLAVLLLPTVLLAQADPLAVVRLAKTESINTAEYKKRLAQAEALTGQTLTDQDKSALLEQLIDVALILQQAAKESFSVKEREVVDSSLALLSQQYGRRVTEAELRQQLQKSGSSFEEFITETSRQFILQKYLLNKFGADVNNIPEPNAKEVEAYYDTYPQQFVVGNRARFSQIFIKTLDLDEAERSQAKRRAEDLFKRIQQGENLGDLAAAYSEESVSRDNKGALPFVVKNDKAMVERFGQEFFDKLFQLKVDQNNLVTSNLGYHIIKVHEFKDKQLLGLNDVVEPVQKLTVRQLISGKLRQQQQQEKLLELQKAEVTALRKQASIRVITENLPFKYEPTS